MTLQKVCVVGVGYVGLPTCIILAEKGYTVHGYDVSEPHIANLLKGIIPLPDFKDRLSAVLKAGTLTLSIDPSPMKDCGYIIITVPTPLDDKLKPDLSCVRSAAEIISKYITKGQLVVLESTVYPGVTEDIVGRTIEHNSGLKAGEDFGLAYCPERFNPGDPVHNIEEVNRILAGSPEWESTAYKLYKELTGDKVYIVKNIRTAEAAKVFENVQRDLNIALVNELALICERIDLDVMEIIDAASSKWNFHPYTPGVGVGGHCLPVDPHYLEYIANKSGLKTKLISAGRETNRSMPQHLVNMLLTAGPPGKVLVCGYSYKPGVNDARESPAAEVVKILKSLGIDYEVYDPYMTPEYFYKHSVIFTTDIYSEEYSAILYLTDHSDFLLVNWSRIQANSKIPILFFDGRRAFKPLKIEEYGMIYFGVGRGCVE